MRIQVHANQIEVDQWYMYVNAVKCNLTELTTKSACVPLVVFGVVTYAHVSEFHVLVDRSMVLRTGGVLWLFVVWQLIAQAVPLSPLSLSLSTVSTVWFVPVPLTAWGLMAGLPGFASHGSSLHLGAGCQ